MVSKANPGIVFAFDAHMSDLFFPELRMATPADHCDIRGCGHGEMTGRMLIEIEKMLLAEPPAAVLVYGRRQFHASRGISGKQAAYSRRPCRGRLAFLQFSSAGGRQ